MQAIDNVTWSVIDGDWYSNEETRGKLVPTRVVEMWGNCKFTRDEGKALSLAHKWASRLPICEYGVNVITYNKTWKQILKNARVSVILHLLPYIILQIILKILLYKQCGI